MLTVLSISTLVLLLSTIVFSGVYIWLNTFSAFTDLAYRNSSIMMIVKTAVILSIVFPLAGCLLAPRGTIYTIVDRASLLYAIITICWLAVVLFITVTLVIALIRKPSFKVNYATAVKKIYSVSLWTIGISGILSWLLS